MFVYDKNKDMPLWIEYRFIVKEIQVYSKGMQVWSKGMQVWSCSYCWSSYPAFTCSRTKQNFHLYHVVRKEKKPPGSLKKKHWNSEKIYSKKAVYGKVGGLGKSSNLFSNNLLFVCDRQLVFNHFALAETSENVLFCEKLFRAHHFSSVLTFLATWSLPPTLSWNHQGNAAANHHWKSLLNI